MRKLHPDLRARLETGATKLARCWRVRRRDGREFGFTNHDADLRFDDTTFLASTGLDSTAVQATTGLAVDNAQIMGALSDAGVTEDEVRAGRFDRARVEHWIVDWERPDLRALMFVGHFGEIRRADGAFEVELRGLTEVLNAPVGRTLQRTCDRRLGDDKCGVDLDRTAFSAEAEIAAEPSDAIFVTTALSGFVDGWFAAGSLLWLSGANAGERSAVKADTAKPGKSRRVALWRRPGAAMAAGDRFRLFAGCDKRLSTCREKFSNLMNFRGFPHIPGDDWVAAYPKDGEVHDGSSRRDF